MWFCGIMVHKKVNSSLRACEQALLFGRAKRVSRERAPRSREALPNTRACSQARLIQIVQVSVILKVPFFSLGDKSRLFMTDDCNSNNTLLTPGVKTT